MIPPRLFTPEDGRRPRHEAPERETPEAALGGRPPNGYNTSMPVVGAMLAPRLLIAVTAVCGAASLGLFGWFAAFGPLGLIRFRFDPATLLAFDAALSGFFFVQHSVMIRVCCRRAASRLIPEHYCGAVYTIASAVALSALVLLWQESTAPLFEAGDRLRWLVRSPAVLGGAVFLWTAGALGKTDLFGVGAIRARMNNTSPNSPRFLVRGPYRWVRHPAYLASILVLWSQPRLTADRLLLNVLFTAWILTGAWLEERDLAARFGQPYRDYQRRVPMLLPWRRPERPYSVAGGSTVGSDLLRTDRGGEP